MARILLTLAARSLASTLQSCLLLELWHQFSGKGYHQCSNSWAYLQNPQGMPAHPVEMFFVYWQDVLPTQMTYRYWSSHIRLPYFLQYLSLTKSSLILYLENSQEYISYLSWIVQYLVLCRFHSAEGDYLFIYGAILMRLEIGEASLLEFFQSQYCCWYEINYWWFRLCL